VENKPSIVIPDCPVADSGSRFPDSVLRLVLLHVTENIRGIQLPFVDGYVLPVMG
jgi:hypothetical protein